MLCIGSAFEAGATGLFSEDFNGYAYFPDQDPVGDPVNKGLPLTSEGADELWLGGRFETPDSGSIDQDLAVQKFGGSGNDTPVGRFEDDAGLVLHVSTAEFIDATLEFDWRTFQTGSTDKVVVGYRVGDIPGFGTGAGESRYMDFTSGPYRWSDPNSGWVELMREPGSDGFGPVWSHESFALPVGAADLFVAFWIDNGEGDYGKIDNVVIAGTPIPEPSTLLLLGFGLGGLALARRHRRV